MANCFKQPFLLKTLLILICTVSLLQGCGSDSKNPAGQDDPADTDPVNNDPAAEIIGMESFNNNEELRAYIVDQYAKSVLPQTVYGPARNDGAAVDNDTAVDYAEAPTNEAPELTPQGEEDSGRYSETNLQEAGVDEADKVKNDGRYIYTAANDSVIIVDARLPETIRQISAVTVNGEVDSLYLYDNTLVIVYRPLFESRYYGDDTDGTEVAGVGFCYWVPVNMEVGVVTVDVSDPTRPQKTSETIIDGNLISSRRVENRLYLVQQFLPDLPPIDYTYEEIESADEVITSNQNQLSGLVLEDLIPFYHTVDLDGNASQERQLVTYDRFYKPSQTSGGSVVTVTTFDLDAPTADIDSVGAIADAHTIYASTKAIYLASTRWNNVAYQNNEMTDIYYTYLFKFSIAPESITCSATGGVAGKIINQFSMGEYNDILRIATTRGELWMGDGSISNEVYCLETNGDRLEVVGNIEDMAPGESIYAVRFLGRRGYVVTFVKVDPLFTLDLSDPTAPFIAGELKVPGYSDYIHPLSDEYLLTIGKATNLDAQQNVWNQGVQLSIFDVRDFENPALLHTEIIGDRGTESEALYNHKAFTYWPDENLLALPIDLYENTSPAYPYDYGQYQYSGLFVYEVSTQNGFHHLGTLRTHDAYYSRPAWTRGVFIDDYVLAVQPEAIAFAQYNAIESTADTLLLNQ